MKELQVPQLRVQVRLLMQDGSELPGSLYAPDTHPDAGLEPLIERLNDTTERFIPFDAEGNADLIHKDWIVWVEISDPINQGEGDEEDRLGHMALQHAPTVSFVLSMGLTVSGRVHYSMPPARSRVVDYLNAAPDFILVQGSERALLVHRRYIVRVRRLPPTP